MFIRLQLLTQSESRQSHLWGAQAEVSGTHHAALQGPLQHDLSGTGASQLCRNLLDDRTAQHRVLLVAPHQPLSPQAAVRLRTATSNCFSEAGFHSERSRCVLASTPAGCSVCSVQPQCTWYWMPEIRQYASISTSWLKGSLFRCTTAGLISANFSSSASSTMSKLLTPARSITTSRALAGHTRDNHRAGVPRVTCVRMKMRMRHTYSSQLALSHGGLQRPPAVFPGALRACIAAQSLPAHRVVQQEHIQVVRSQVLQGLQVRRDTFQCWVWGLTPASDTCLLMQLVPLGTDAACLRKRNPPVRAAAWLTQSRGAAGAASRSETPCGGRCRSRAGRPPPRAPSTTLEPDLH